MSQVDHRPAGPNPLTGKVQTPLCRQIPVRRGSRWIGSDGGWRAGGIAMQRAFLRSTAVIAALALIAPAARADYAFRFTLAEEQPGAWIYAGFGLFNMTEPAGAFEVNVVYPYAATDFSPSIVVPAGTLNFSSWDRRSSHFSLRLGLHVRHAILVFDSAIPYPIEPPRVASTGYGFGTTRSSLWEVVAMRHRAVGRRSQGPHRRPGSPYLPRLRWRYG